MKNKIYLIVILLNTITIFGQAQYLSNAVNSPTSVANPTVFIGANPVPSGTFKVYIKDDIRWETYNINNFSSQVLASTSLVYKPISYTPSSSEISTALGYTPLSVETDPIWISDKTNYYTKSASDSRYLQNFTEADPIWTSVSGGYRTKVQNDGLYVSLTGSYVDPSWIVSIPYTKITGTPSIPSAQVNADWNSLSGISQILNKPTIPTDNNQLLNGNGFITAFSTNSLTNKSGNISQWTNDTGYLTGITSGNVTTALGYTPYSNTNPAGYISAFTELDPTVPSYSKTLTGFSVIKTSTDPLYKAIGYTPTSLEITTALGFTPYNSTNPNGYISSIPAQSFASLTGKPTTITGYGITDAYPLTGNPSNFLITITSAQVNTALGYTAYNGTSNPNGFLTNITSGQITTALGFTPLSAEVDGSITNEIQSLSIVGSTLSLSNGGGSVAIPGTVYTAGTSISIASNVITNTAPDQTVSLVGVGGLVVSGTYPSFTLTQYIPTVNSNVSRSLNTNYTISTTKTVSVTYTVRIAYNITVLLGSTGAIDLQYSLNGGSSWITVSTVSNNLNLGLALTGYNDFILSGDIPPNALVRLNSTISNATNTYRFGQETF